MERHADHKYVRFFLWSAIVMIVAALALKAFAQDPKSDAKKSEDKPILLKSEDRDFFEAVKKADSNATAEQLRQENEQLRQQLVEMQKRWLAALREARLWKVRAENNCPDCELDETGTTLKRPKR